MGKANSCGACLTLCCNRLTKPHAGDYDQNGIAYVLPYGAEPTSDGVAYVPSNASPGCCHPMYSGPLCCCQCCCCRGKPVSYYVNRPAYPPRQVMVADKTSVQDVMVADTTSVQEVMVADTSDTTSVQIEKVFEDSDFQVSRT